MGRWADYLVRRQVSQSLCAAIEKETKLTDAERDALSARYDRAVDMKPLRAVAKALGPRLSGKTRAELAEQVREMGEDLRYAKTDFGKTVLTINAWLEPWYKDTIRADAAFDDVMIGGDAGAPFRVLVTGRIATRTELDRLRQIVDSRSPPFDVEYRVAVLS